MTQKLSIDYVKEESKKRGSECVSYNYKNALTKLKFRCSRGHIFESSWNSIQQGQGCGSCKYENTSLGMRGKKHYFWNGGYRQRGVPTYETYAEQISYAENVRRNSNDKNILEVKCAYCGQWFTPSIPNLNSRIQSLKGNALGEHRLYCSNGCKKACPIFGQYKYPKGFKPATSREVQPQLRQMVLKRDDYTCQKCDKMIDAVELHCHHIDPVANNPIESADTDNCITFCKDCHKEVHKQSGCKYHELRCTEKVV